MLTVLSKKSSILALMVATLLAAVQGSAPSAHAAPPAGYPVLSPLELLAMNEGETRTAGVVKIKVLSEHFKEAFGQKSLEAELRTKLERLESSEAYQLCLKPKFLMSKKRRSEHCAAATAEAQEIESALFLRNSQLLDPIFDLMAVVHEEHYLSNQLRDHVDKLKEQGPEKEEEARAWERAWGRQSLITGWVSNFIQELTWEGPVSRGMDLRREAQAAALKRCDRYPDRNREIARSLNCRRDAFHTVLGTGGERVTAQILGEIDAITADSVNRITGQSE